MKKVLSLLLVAILVLGMSTVSFAATKAAGYDTPAANAGVPSYSADLEAGLSLAWEIPALVDGDGLVLNLAKARDVKNAKVTVRSSLKSGSKFIDEVKIDDAVSSDALVAGIKVPCVVFSIVDPFVSTGDVDYNYFFYLTFDGKRNNDVEFHAEGQILIKTTDVGADDDYVDLSEGQVADVSAYVKAIEVDLGNGVTLKTKLYNGKKYFGVADCDVSDSDDAVMSKYPSIDQVVNLTTIGLSAAGNIVYFTDFGDGYVYDKDMKYLGRANEALPYSTKYYISNIELEVEGDDVGEGEAPEDGEGEAPTNGNDNPETGR